MTSNTADIVVGVIGGALIPLALYIGQRSVSKLQMTAELLKDFNGREMSESRRKARLAVLSNPNSSYADFDASTSDENKEALFTIMRFYHRMNALREAGMLKDDRLLRLFGPVFAYWWSFSFEPQLVRSKGWRVRGDIVQLKEFFERRVAAESKSSEWAGWLQDGTDDRLSPPITPAPLTAPI